MTMLPERFSPTRVPPGVSMVLLTGLVPNDNDRKAGWPEVF